MDFSITPVAYASITSLIGAIEKVVINPLIIMMFAIALVYFMYGVTQFLLNPAKEEIRKSGKSHMLWGVVGMFIMVAVFGIMRLVLNTLGESKINIQNNGSIIIKPTKLPLK